MTIRHSNSFQPKQDIWIRRKNSLVWIDQLRSATFIFNHRTTSFSVSVQWDSMFVVRKKFTDTNIPKITIMDMRDTTEPSGFDKLLSKNVPHIFEKIFLSLDYESFKRCLEVNSAWKGLLSSGSIKVKAKLTFKEEILEEGKKLVIATEDGNKDVAIRILSKDCGLLDINSTTTDGSTALHFAASNASADMVQKLLKRGADPNWANGYRCTPLNYAAYHGHCNAVQILLDAGSDPDIARQDGFTPLHNAALWGHTDVVKVLVDRGAAVNVEGEKGQTPLSLAGGYGHNDIVVILIAKGAQRKGKRKRVQ